MVNKWEDLCVAWEQSPYPKPVKLPYDIEDNCKFPAQRLFKFVTERTVDLLAAEVQKELMDEEKARLASRGIALHKTSPVAFLIIGLELEDAQ